MNQRGGIELLVLAIVALASFMLVGGSFTFNNSLPQNNGQAVNIQDVQPGPAQNTLQIQGLKTATPAPTAPPPVPPPPEYQPPPDYQPPPVPPPPVGSPGPTPVPTPALPICDLATEIKTPSCSCFGGMPVQIVCIVAQGTAGSYYDNGRYLVDRCFEGPNDPTCLMSTSPAGCFEKCYGKPVIYLYPTVPTYVSVKIETTGKIIVSDPLYVNGWDNVLAFPDGKLQYKGKQYKELFYETSVTQVTPPKTGIVVAIKDAKKTLYDLTARLGLLKSEQDELVDWWLPRLQALNKPYVLISLVNKEEKEKTDKVLITPKPDTRIEFILYFKGLDYGISVPSLNLPPTPRRIGFTAVEWGGIIDY